MNPDKNLINTNKASASIRVKTSAFICVLKFLGIITLHPTLGYLLSYQVKQLIKMIDKYGDL